MAEPEPRPYLAEWWPRVGALLLDSLVIGAMSLGCLVASIIAMAPFGADGDAGGPVWLLLTLVVGVTYFTGLNARKGEHNGQTFGKQAMNIRVVRDDGRPIRL